MGIYNIILLSSLYLFSSSNILASTELVETARSQSVKVSAIFYSADKKIASQNICTGVVYKNTEAESVVITAKHCIEELGLAVEGIPVNHYLLSNNNDIALLFLDRKIPNKFAAKVNEKILMPAERVLVFGYPRGNEYSDFGHMLLSSSVAIVKMSDNKVIFNFDLYLLRAKIISGCSGGGLFNKHGELVAINVVNLKHNGNYGMSVPIKYAMDIIREAYK